MRRWWVHPDAARVAAVLAAVVIALGVWTVVMAPRSPAGAATNNGRASIVAANRVQMPLRSGGSSTRFNLELGTNPACPGDSAGGDYRIQSFMIPASADIDAMTFDANGPVAVDGEFRQPLFDITSSPYVNELTDLAVPPAVTGGISGLPTFNFTVFAPGDIPAGSYATGIACTLGPAGSTQLESRWSTTITVAVSADDAPAGITWTARVAGGQPTATTDPTATTVAGGGATATTLPGDGATATTVAGGATTTMPAAVAAAFTGAGPSDPSLFATVGDLPIFGTSRWYRVGWAVCLLIFGRMAYLLVRRPKSTRPAVG